MASIMSSQSAKNQVFDTTELLEMILIEVDPKTLLISGQRVDKRFKQVIDNFIKLQRALFFKQAPNDGCKYGIQGLNPLLILHPNHDLNSPTATRWLGYQIKYNRHYKILEHWLRWDLNLDSPREKAPAIEPSWRRMYIKHGLLDFVHLDLRLESGGMSRPCWVREPVRIPSNPMVMAEYEALVEKVEADWHALKALLHEACRRGEDIGRLLPK